MKNIKTALSLALLAVAPTIYAQNIDTKAPAEPGFMVTLNVTNNGGGTDSLKIAKQSTPPDALLDSTLFTGSKTGFQILYGTKARMGLQAESGKKIKSMTVGTTTVTWDASTTDGSKGTVSFKTGGTNYYSLPLGAIEKNTDIAIIWEEKASIEVKATGTTQTVKDNDAAIDEPTVTFTPESPASLTKKYLDKDGAEVQVSAIKAAGTYYIKLNAPETADYKALDMTIPLIVNNKLALTADDSKKPTISGTYQEGQPLSAVAIIGGDSAYKYSNRVIKGSWAWAAPNQLLVANSSTGNQTYDAIFTPDSSAIYNNATAKIAVDAQKVATVTVAQTTGGVVAIENASPDNRYVGTTLNSYKQIKLVATPAVGYKIVKWVSPAADIDDSEVAVNKDYTPSSSEPVVVSAQFAKATRKVQKGSLSNGTIEVWNGETMLDLGSDGKSVDYGTTLTIVAKPATGYEVSKVGYTYAATKAGASDGPAVETTSFVVGGEAGDYTVSAVFTEKPKEKKMITVTAPLNGSVTMLDADGNKVNPNSSVLKGSVVTVIAMPNKGYKLATLLAGDTDIKEAGAVTVNKDMQISATFTEEEYKVSVTAPDQVEIIGVQANDKTKFNTQYQSVTAKIKDEYAGTHKLVSLLINNRSVTNGDPLTIEGPTVISAQVEALTPLSILNDKTMEVIYDGSVPAYAVKTAAGLGGFNVSFWQGSNEVTPTAVGTYDVRISREHDNLYADYNNTTDYKLVVKPGVPGIKKIAFSDKLEGSGEATVAGTWTATRPTGQPEATLRSLKAAGTTTIYFVPTDQNIGYVTATTVAEDQASSAKKVTITNIAGGTVSLMNGSTPLAADQAYEGLPLTVVAKADKGNVVDWSKIKLGSTSLTDPNSRSFTISADITLVAETGAFKAKTAATTPTDATITTTYGSSIPAVSGLQSGATWSILYGKKGADQAIQYTTATPKEVGTYTIFASCEEGEKYGAVSNKEIGTLTINKAVLASANVIEKPIASPVVLNGELSTSMLTGGEIKYNGVVVPGTFSWTPTSSTKVESAQDYDVTFTPQDQANYDATGLGIKSYVSLMGVRSFVMTTDAKNVVFKDAQNKPIVSGDKVPVGMKLYVTANSGTIESVVATGTGASTGSETRDGVTTWYCIAGSADFTVTVTFKSGTEGGGDTPAEGTPVTGISLNKSTLTLPRLKSEKLVATVTPTGATKKEVKWTSTNPEIATVDADGTVKAVKYGQATIIATTVDGGFTAMCQVNVDFATAIEKILSESLVYSRNGQIIIEPAAPVEISIINLGGQVIYNNSISSTVQVPANNGVYIVRMAAAGKATTTKVIVR